MNAQKQPSDLRIPETELIIRADGCLYHLGIKPEQVAPKVIIVGDPERVAIVSAMMDSVEVEIANREFVFHTGVYKGKRISVLSTGIGVDNIDIVINELDAAVNIDFENRKPKAVLTSLEIVRIGTCGALIDDIEIGSFVASAYAFGLDGVPHSYVSSYTDKEQQLVVSLRNTFEHLQSQSGLYAVEGSDELRNRIAYDCLAGITATANGFYGPQGRSVRLKSLMEPNIDAYSKFEFDSLNITNFEMECSGIYALASMLGHKALTVCAILAHRQRKEFHKNPSASIESLVRLVLERF